MPEGVEKIGDMVFYCSKVESITIPKSIKTIPEGAFRGAKLRKILIKEGCTEIGRWAFYYCQSLTSITLPSTLKTIGDAAFFGAGIKQITIPKNVETIKEDAFGQSPLEKITIPKKTKNADYALQYCFELKEATILNPNLKMACLFGKPGQKISINGIENYRKLYNPSVIKGYKGSTAEKFVKYINKHKNYFNHKATFKKIS